MSTRKEILERIISFKRKKPLLKFFLLEDGIYYKCPDIADRTGKAKEKVTAEYVESLLSNPRYKVQIVEPTKQPE